MNHLRNSLAAMILFGCAFTTNASAQALDKVIFAKSSPWGLVDAEITFGIALGFFKEERIDPEFVVVGGGYAAIQQILGGRAQTGYIGSEALPISLQPGNTPIPLRMTYNLFRSPIFELVVLARSPVHKFADLKGKTIGVQSLTVGSIPVTRAALMANGIGPDGYTFLPVGFGSQAIQALTSGQIDALNLIHTFHAQMENSGIQLRRLAYPAAFESIPATGLAFSDEYIRTRPDVVARYGRAFAKSTLACAANPEGCVKAFWRAHPEQKPLTPEADAVVSAVRILNANFKRLLPQPNAPYGAYERADWTNLLKALQTGSAVTDVNIPLDRVFTNQFTSEYNKFDKATVEAAAKAYK